MHFFAKKMPKLLLYKLKQYIPSKWLQSRNYFPTCTPYAFYKSASCFLKRLQLNIWLVEFWLRLHMYDLHKDEQVLIDTFCVFTAKQM